MCDLSSSIYSASLSSRARFGARLVLVVQLRLSRTNSYQFCVMRQKYILDRCLRSGCFVHPDPKACGLSMDCRPGCHVSPHVMYVWPVTVFVVLMGQFSYIYIYTNI